jgi:hypothetical protein
MIKTYVLISNFHFFFFFFFWNKASSHLNKNHVLKVQSIVLPHLHKEYLPRNLFRGDCIEIIVIIYLVDFHIYPFT